MEQRKSIGWTKVQPLEQYTSSADASFFYMIHPVYLLISINIMNELFERISSIVQLLDDL